MKTPKASGAPDPMPRYARFAHPTPLRYMSARSGGPELGAPLDQMLDPLLSIHTLTKFFVCNHPSFAINKQINLNPH